MASRTGSRASVQRLATPSTGDRRRFRRALLRWYDRNGRDLPWRRTDDPYHILVSEIMLQQTQVDRVLPKYREWLDKYPSFHALAGADEEDAVKTWYPLGYNIRPRRLHAIAREAVGRFGGELPEDEETLRSFKGIGPYTAGALMSFAFRKRAPILDTNVARVLFRVVIGRGNPKAHQMRKHLWRLSELMMPQKRVFDYNQALMDFGALVCPARNPKCPECPMAGFCRAYGLGARDSGLSSQRSRDRCTACRPAAARQAGIGKHVEDDTAMKHIVVAAAVVERDGAFLLTRRLEGTHLAGHWEFPGGKLREGETLAECLVREIREELDADVEVGAEILATTHGYPDRSIELRFFRCALKGEPKPAMGQEMRWVAAADLASFPLPPADHELVSILTGRTAAR